MVDSSELLGLLPVEMQVLHELVFVVLDIFALFLAELIQPILLLVQFLFTLAVSQLVTVEHVVGHLLPHSTEVIVRPPLSL